MFLLILGLAWIITSAIEELKDPARARMKHDERMKDKDLKHQRWLEEQKNRRNVRENGGRTVGDAVRDFAAGAVDKATERMKDKGAGAEGDGFLRRVLSRGWELGRRGARGVMEKLERRADGRKEIFDGQFGPDGWDPDEDDDEPFRPYGWGPEGEEDPVEPRQWAPDGEEDPVEPRQWGPDEEYEEVDEPGPPVQATAEILRDRDVVVDGEVVEEPEPEPRRELPAGGQQPDQEKVAPPTGGATVFDIRDRLQRGTDMSNALAPTNGGAVANGSDMGSAVAAGVEGAHLTRGWAQRNFAEASWAVLEKLRVAANSSIGAQAQSHCNEDQIAVMTRALASLSACIDSMTACAEIFGGHVTASHVVHASGAGTHEGYTEVG